MTLIDKLLQVSHNLERNPVYNGAYQHVNSAWDNLADLQSKIRQDPTYRFLLGNPNGLGGAIHEAVSPFSTFINHPSFGTAMGAAAALPIGPKGGRDVDPYLYHGTAHDLGAHHEVNGHIVPSAHGSLSGKPEVWLTENKDYARQYGPALVRVLKSDLPKSAQYRDHGTGVWVSHEPVKVAPPKHANRMLPFVENWDKEAHIVTPKFLQENPWAQFFPVARMPDGEIRVGMPGFAHEDSVMLSDWLKHTGSTHPEHNGWKHMESKGYMEGTGVLDPKTGRVIGVNVGLDFTGHDPRQGGTGSHGRAGGAGSKTNQIAKEMKDTANRVFKEVRDKHYGGH